MYEFLGYQVQDVMTPNPTTVSPEASLAEAEEIFEKHDWNGLPVVDTEGGIVGFLTKLDLLGAFEFGDGQVFPPYDEIMRRRVRSAMTRDVYTVSPRTPLTRVLTKMLHTRCKSLPVLDSDDRLAGIVAREDLIIALRRAVSGEQPPEGDGIG